MYLSAVCPRAVGQLENAFLHLFARASARPQVRVGKRPDLLIRGQYAKVANSDGDANNQTCRPFSRVVLLRNITSVGFFSFLKAG